MQDPFYIIRKSRPVGEALEELLVTSQLRSMYVYKDSDGRRREAVVIEGDVLDRVTNLGLGQVVGTHVHDH